MANLKISDGVSSVIYGEGVLVQVGVIMPYAGATAPTGWLLCDGSTFSSTTYPQLYTLLGNSTTLPNLRQKYLLGYDSASPSRSLASTINSTHNHAVSYPANSPVNAGAFVTNLAYFDHNHGISYNGVNTDNVTHGHTGYYSGTTGGMTNAGNYSNAAPVNVSVATTSHTHNWYYAFNYDSNVAGNHGTASNGAAYQNPGHSHNFVASTNSGTLANSTTNTIPATVYINFMIKAG
jgi:microcystin-dependent protein